MRRRFGRIGLLALAALTIFLGGCSNNARRPGRVRVVATYSILGDLVQNVAGDSAEVTTLVGPDCDAHTFEPTPKDGVSLAEADIVFENGVNFEGWLDKLHKSSKSKAKRIVVTEGLQLRGGECNHAHKPGEKHEHEDDPHVWHDVKNAIHMVSVIRDQLAEADPPSAETYKANATAYLAKLKALDAWVVEKVTSVPKQNRKLVTSHDTFGYFAERHGFEIVGTMLTSVSTEASDPSPATFARLVESVKAAKVPAIFAENVHNPKLMERLGKEAGVRLAQPLFTDALGKPGSEGATYEKMVRHNVTIIVEALK
ncbi:MAG: metal ABC transporter substrate-binding protein [Planctomycetes bacterium]|nr:metal ABC transporter substrate-binding protein [Planctomycetota bacterium]